MVVRVACTGLSAEGESTNSPLYNLFYGRRSVLVLVVVVVAAASNARMNQTNGTAAIRDHGRWLKTWSLNLRCQNNAKSGTTWGPCCRSFAHRLRLGGL